MHAETLLVDPVAPAGGSPCPSARDRHGAGRPAAGKARSSRLSLFVFIDALGWELAQRHVFLEGLLTVRRPLATVFGYSSTCDPTILTGRLAREHGHFSFFRYAPGVSPFGVCRHLRFLPRAITRRGRVRRVLSRAIRRYHGYTGYFQIYNMPFEVLPLFDYTEKRDIYQPGGINSGIPTVFDQFRQARVPFHLSDWRRGERENLRAAEEAMQGGQVRFVYLYLAAMDAMLHAEGTLSPRAAAQLAWYDASLRRLLEVAQRRYGEVRLHVFSDHGMTDVVQACDLMAAVQATGLEFGRDYAAVYDSTMARFWFLRPGARQRLTACLEAQAGGHILSPEALHRWGCDFPDQRYGEEFFLADPGVLICPSFMGESLLAGMHGYAPEHPTSVALYASNAAVERPPERLDELHGVMLKEADL
ncbi:MAG: alkaline phosphatase family protein [Candidatus Latescibacterota bacterium]